MKKKILIQGLLFLLLTLLLPLLITKLLSHNAPTDDLPNIDEIRIYASADSQMLTLEEYVIGVVLANIPVHYELETLKAQAVISRTYALKNISLCNEKRSTTSLVDTLDPHSKGYTTNELGLPYSDPKAYLTYTGTMEHETYLANVTRAVKETKGQVITYKNNLITPLFFSTSAGKTRNSAELWSQKIPYLVSVDSNQDVESSNYLKVSIYTIEATLQMLQTAYQNHLLDASEYDYQVYRTLPFDANQFFDSVEIMTRDSAGYVLTVSLGGILVTGDSFANALGLNSSYFYFEDYEESVRFICNGLGHGIGFSQYGANVLAKESDATYEELLSYYYANIKIKEIDSLYE